MYEAEGIRMAARGCSPRLRLLPEVLPHVHPPQCRGAISVAERNSHIGRVRNLARLCAESYLKQREEMGFPLLKK